MPQNGFASLHRRDPERCLRYGLALNKEHNEVIGIIKLRLSSPGKTNWMQNGMHKVAENEVYIDLLVVIPDKRGNGVGTILLQWAEEQATVVHKANKLSLGVTKGNPAIRLYERFGFVPISKSLGLVWAVGRPNGRFGAELMEKEVEHDIVR